MTFLSIFPKVTVFILFALMINGCVSSGRYDIKEKEALKLTSDLSSLSEEQSKLKASQFILLSEKSALQKETLQLNAEKISMQKKIDKLEADNKELDSLLKSKSDTFSKTVSEQRDKYQLLEKKSTELEQLTDTLKKENKSLQAAKDEEVKKASKTYEDLLASMKNEIAKGEVTISELKGKLTVNMVDAVLFDSGKAEVKKGGLAVLNKVVDILKEIKDKAIRIEGHTDNVQIKGSLTQKYQTNWELSAARAINVTRYLQSQGIDPALLSSAAFGEYKPVAPNASDEGRAKNRRIEIILVPHEK